MKKLITLTAALAASTTGAFAQAYLGGLDFVVGQDFSSDVAFDRGPEQSLFTLNVQTGIADDGFEPFGFTDPGWAAQGDIFTDGVNNVPAGTPGFETSVFQSFGFAPSTDLFGNTSANAQGYSATAGAHFMQGGIFTITSSAPITDLQIQFDVATVAGGAAGTLDVGAQPVAVTSAATNYILSLPDFAAGGTLEFDLSGVSDGIVLDNVMFSGTVIPEPSTYALMFGGIAAMAAVARRRKTS